MQFLLEHRCILIFPLHSCASALWQPLSLHLISLIVIPCRSPVPHFFPSRSYPTRLRWSLCFAWCQAAVCLSIPLSLSLCLSLWAAKNDNGGRVSWWFMVHLHCVCVCVCGWRRERQRQRARRKINDAMFRQVKGEPQSGVRVSSIIRKLVSRWCPALPVVCGSVWNRIYTTSQKVITAAQNI